MIRRNLISLLAVIGGVMLATSIDLNRDLSLVSSPVFASWLAHGIGLATALLLISVQYPLRSPGSTTVTNSRTRAPLWSYFGGVPGGLAVVLATLVANTSIGLATTIALMIAGQICFGLIVDRMGLFGMPRRRFGLSDIASIGMIGAGSLMLLYNEA